MVRRHEAVTMQGPWTDVGQTSRAGRGRRGCGRERLREPQPAPGATPGTAGAGGSWRAGRGAMDLHRPDLPLPKVPRNLGIGQVIQGSSRFLSQLLQNMFYNACPYEAIIVCKSMNATGITMTGNIPSPARLNMQDATRRDVYPWLSRMDLSMPARADVLRVRSTRGDSNRPVPRR